MKVTIDAAGRIVVPKRLRDALGLSPGTRLEAAAVDGRLELEPEHGLATVETAPDGLDVIVVPPGTPPIGTEAVRDWRLRLQDPYGRGDA